MEEDKVISAAAKAMIGKERFRLTIPVAVQQEKLVLSTPKRSFIDKILRRPSQLAVPLQVIETERTLIIYPCKTANMYRIASTALELPEAVITETLGQAVLPMMKDRQVLKNIIYIVAAGIQNNHLEPDESLIKFLELNLDHEDLLLLMHHTLDNLGMDSFLNSIVLARGTVNILKPETSPKDGRE